VDEADDAASAAAEVGEARVARVAVAVEPISRSKVCSLGEVAVVAVALGLTSLPFPAAASLAERSGAPLKMELYGINAFCSWPGRTEKRGNT